MENLQRQQIKKYVILILSHWKLLAVCLLASLTLGLGIYLKLPKVYRCTALLSYERQQINPARMAPEQRNQQIRGTVSTLRDVVISRKNIEIMIEQFGLYQEEMQQLPLEDIIDYMRKKIQIMPSPRGDTFTVTFEGNDPDQVMKVTNDLASRFIQENLKYREERATETSKYTKDELSLAKAVLDEKEQAMRDYKLKYYNSMPEQRDSNLARLNSLHEQYQNIQDSIQDLERTKVMAQEQINLRRRLVGAMNSGTPSSSSHADQPVTPWQRLQQLRNHLASLKVKYTDKHPEIRHTKQLINNLAAELKGKRAPTSGQNVEKMSPLQDPEIGQLQIQLKEVSLNIQKLRADQLAVHADIPKYEQWIAAAPVREAEWNALTRDYSELRRNYDFLVSQNLQASSVEHLEKKQKGSKFKIVDKARFPEKPFAPKFIRAMLLALIGGLGGGIGLVLAMDFIDTSFKDVSEVENYLGLPVVCSIPYLKEHREVGKQRKQTVAIGAGFMMYALLFMVVLLYCVKKGLIVF